MNATIDGLSVNVRKLEGALTKIPGEDRWTLVFDTQTLAEALGFPDKDTKIWLLIPVAKP